MSKVTPIKPEETRSNRFYDGPEGEPSSAAVFAGLKGVCRALEELNPPDDVDQCVLLAQAARALADLLDARQE